MFGTYSGGNSEVKGSTGAEATVGELVAVGWKEEPEVVGGGLLRAAAASNASTFRLASSKPSWIEVPMTTLLPSALLNSVSALRYCASASLGLSNFKLANPNLDHAFHKLGSPSVAALASS
jgi:hypothetical protein